MNNVTVVVRMKTLCLLQFDKKIPIRAIKQMHELLNLSKYRISQFIKSTILCWPVRRPWMLYALSSLLATVMLASSFTLNLAMIKLTYTVIHQHNVMVTIHKLITYM